MQVILGLFVAAMTAYSLLIYFTNRAARDRRRGRPTARDITMPDDEWVACYLAGRTSQVDQWRDCMMAIATAFGCHYTQLRPTDRFDTELKYDGISWLGIESDDETEELEDQLLPELIGEDRFDRIMDEHAPFGTIADLCRACAAEE